MEMDKLDGMSMNIEQTELDKLHSVFPQCFSEGKLDIDKLLSLCGEYIDNDFEKYKFEWKGKSESLRLAQRRSMGTLRPCPEESVNFDTTQNLYIEGDNLEVLKLLQTAYYRKVKMIYIDPPYNTGNDFIYEDNFADPIAKYKEVTQQTTKSNPETMGRYHTNWLNMMYPRLRLAANLLRDDGVIFISIDDGEAHNLRKLCDEIFGEENFAADIIWQKVYSPRMDVQGFSASHDHILCYVRQSYDSIRKETFSQDVGQFSFVDSTTGKKYRRRSVRKEGSHSTRSERPNLWFPLFSPDGTEVYPVKPDGTEGCWRWSKATYNANLADDMVEWVLTENGWQVYAKQFLDEDAARPPQTLWFHQEVGHNHSAAEEVKKMLGAKVFDSPKPKELIIKMLKISTASDDDDIILDFFSGSATTAHAVMQLNAEDGGNRRFIMVQLPEICDEKSEAYKAGYKNICEIGKERIRRAGKQLFEKGVSKTTMEKLSEEVFQPRITDDGMIEQESKAEYRIKMDSKTDPHLDIGFKVFKLDTSNLKAWDATVIDEDNLLSLYERMNEMIDTMKSDRTDMDMVYEIILKMGVPLTDSVTPVDIGSKTAYCVGDECQLLICLQEGLTTGLIEQMANEYTPSKIILSEKCFADDTAMSNVHYILKDRKIELKLV